MALTVDQKRNMLILAGYEPRMYGETEPRIVIVGAQTPAIIKGAHARQEFEWEYHCDWGYVPGKDAYALFTWDDMKLGTIPDELIYQAIDI